MVCTLACAHWLTSHVHVTLHGTLVGLPYSVCATPLPTHICLCPPPVPASACLHLPMPPCACLSLWVGVFFFFFFPFLLVFMTICTCLHTSGCTSLCPLAPTHLTCMHNITWHSQVHLMACVPHHLTCPHQPKSLVQVTLHGTLTGLPHGAHTTPPDLLPSAYAPFAVASTTAPLNVHVPYAGLYCTPPLPLPLPDHA